MSCKYCTHIKQKLFFFALKEKKKYLKKFRTLPEVIHRDANYINITMIGGIGAGKSSILNTVVTALMNTGEMYTDYKTAPKTSGSSKTGTVGRLIVQ